MAPGVYLTTGFGSRGALIQMRHVRSGLTPGRAATADQPRPVAMQHLLGLHEATPIQPLPAHDRELTSTNHMWLVHCNAWALLLLDGGGLLQ
jgi:hypothetical protein